MESELGFLNQYEMAQVISGLNMVIKKAKGEIQRNERREVPFVPATGKMDANKMKLATAESARQKILASMRSIQ